MNTRAVIEQAQGMVMLTFTIDAPAAFDVMVGRSQRTNRRLVEAARGILATGTGRGE